MLTVLAFFAGTGLALQLLAGLMMVPRLQHTSLTAAWWAWLFAWSCWTGTWCATVPLSVISPAIADQLWYTITVIVVAVPIAVLGARRPGHIVWLLFVLLPLILVLCWPAWIDLPRALRGARLSLEEPTLIGVGLVTLMGFGNYVGTRWTLASLFLIAGVGCVMLPLSIWGNAMQPQSELWRTLATLLNSIAGVSVAIRTQTESQNRLATIAEDVYNSPDVVRRVAGFDRLWFTFRDLYGLVWARRFQERINQYAQQESWPLQLEWFGWTDRRFASPSTAPSPQTPSPPPRKITTVELDRIEQQQRWLLTRFVQPEWIDRHLS